MIKYFLICFLSKIQIIILFERYKGSMVGNTVNTRWIMTKSLQNKRNIATSLKDGARESVYDF